MTSNQPPAGWAIEGGDWGKVAKQGPGDRGVVLHRAPKKKPPRILTMREWSSACVAGALYRFDGGVFMEKSTKARMFVRWYREGGALPETYDHQKRTMQGQPMDDNGRGRQGPEAGGQLQG